LREQSRERFIEKNKAEEIYSKLKNLSKDEASNVLKELAETNEKLFDKVSDISEEEKLGLNLNDRLIKQLGVENGERAKYILSQLKNFKTREEARIFLMDLSDKKLLTDEVLESFKR